MSINKNRIFTQNLTRSQLTRLGESILALADDRTVIQSGRNKILTDAIEEEVSHPDYDGTSSFISHMVHRLCRIYDFHDLKRETQSIKEKTIYNETISLWKEFTGQEEL